VPYANLNNPQTLNLYALVADNPETFADLDGHDPDVEFRSPTVENMFNTISNQSESFRTELGAAKEDHNVNVIVQDAGLQKMGEHAPGDAVVTRHEDGSLTIIINVKPTDEGTAEHEMGHEKDARTNTDQFFKDAEKTKKNQGGPNKQAHDDRPEEQRADKFKDKVEKERKEHRQQDKQKQEDEKKKEKDKEPKNKTSP
jgi:hypothetical protein